MTAKYLKNTGRYQISLNRKEAELLAYYGSCYDYLIPMLKMCDEPVAGFRIYVDNKFTVQRDLDRAALENV